MPVTSLRKTCVRPSEVAKIKSKIKIKIKSKSKSNSSMAVWLMDESQCCWLLLFDFKYLRLL